MNRPDPSSAADPAAGDAQATADRVRHAMYTRDRAAQGLGIEILAMGPGRATAAMQVRAAMLNGFDICHGGYLTTLADTAFAYACNAGNVFTVAAGLSIDFVAPAHEGDRLVAEAIEVAVTGRTGVYDVTVRDAQGRTLALFRGRAHRVKGRPAVPAVEGAAAPAVGG